MCKLNPFYEEVVMLRFRALTDLSNVWQEDISQYV
ncbi:MULTISPECIES: Mo-dependent nitrogenase C-terminal domain-containing protein [unclassified Thermosynechococcus]|nr:MULTISPECIES: Mo-dependent nitrogenase C-terminal domain-containing protein [unclassified Thermosynechococcus]MDR5637974.1 Mo-dependent nitrogenase C-terminal domain-containing protein [Thermosynechococcus sp. PP42]MDR7920762.1 Mo-dependent nitrogenase C-terminal domain-containing protein [Thermosynechococcus sp. HY213]WKT82456.1 Mo-dependent nitrogenase C-terminal domain-containing protein [Thermosynechococcus sp. PP45]WNC23507.1 Mo-dependent nitrogenase C-terminal domain-containing protein